MPDEFSRCHPLVNFLYFCFVIGFAMFCLHPICLGLSLLVSLLYAARLTGGKSLRTLRRLLPFAAFAVLLNAGFNHAGLTVLFYLPTGNPVTGESILYGVASAAMLASVLLWFICWSAVMSSDKFLYLFGRVIPSLSLVLSMTMRFIPRFKAQFESVWESQKALGNEPDGEGLLTRLRHVLQCFSAVITWSLENTVDTADSMRARGYGTARRTCYTNYRMDERDRTLLLWICACGIFLICGCAAKGLDWRWFPNVQGMLWQPLTIILYLDYAVLAATPLLLDWKCKKSWNALSSTI